MNTLSLAAQIQSLLFVRTDAVSITWLAKTLEVPRQDIVAGIADLREHMRGQGIVLVEHDDNVMLATHPDMATLIEILYTREVTTPLSKAALETLAIILYSGPLLKTEIDHIRGVNSQFMLRNLLVRGLIEKKDNPDDKRRSLYQASNDTFTFLGISRIEDLPEYEACMARLEELREGIEDDIQE
ncbi:SMC-Scp complex subunit ScpB [Candidatus Nomurabacteria bacterium]|nr:SMC-Scp complex subunit ScpB [Candidatus Nomurabacteria bacterium]